MARECMRNLRARFDALGLTCRVNGYRYDVMLGDEQVNSVPLNRDSILIWLDGAESTRNIVGFHAN